MFSATFQVHIQQEHVIQFHKRLYTVILLHMQTPLGVRKAPLVQMCFPVSGETRNGLGLINSGTMTPVKKAVPLCIQN